MWNILEPDESLPSIDIERGETIDLLLSLPLLGEEARKLALLSDQIDPAIVAALDRSIAEDDTVTHPGRVHFPIVARSEEHTSELQSLMRISYAVFCLKKKTKHEQYD